MMMLTRGYFLAHIDDVECCHKKELHRKAECKKKEKASSLFTPPTDQQNDLESMKGMEGSNATLRGEYRNGSLSGVAPRVLIKRNSRAKFEFESLFC